MRLAAFAIPLVILLLLGMIPWLAALLAAIIGLCVSYIFFARTRNALSQSLYEKRKNKRPSTQQADEDAEDEVVDNALAEEAPGNP